MEPATSIQAPEREPATHDERIILVGEAPGPRTDPRAPLFPMPRNSAGYRLFELTGLEWRSQYLARFQRCNIFANHPGTWDAQKWPKDKWLTREARFAADAMRFFFERRRVIFVGRRVAMAFGYGAEKLPFLEWDYCATWRYQFACLPHTSGRSHWYNDPENKRAASEFLTKALNS